MSQTAKVCVIPTQIAHAIPTQIAHFVDIFPDSSVIKSFMDFFILGKENPFFILFSIRKKLKNKYLKTIFIIITLSNPIFINIKILRIFNIYKNIIKYII